MGTTANRMILARRRAREARVQRLVARNDPDDRIDELMTLLVTASERADAARAELAAAEGDAGRALARLVDDGVLLRDVVGRTGVAVVQCRRLLRLGRALLESDSN